MRKVVFLVSLVIISGNVSAMLHNNVLSEACSSSHQKEDVRNRPTKRKIQELEVINLVSNPSETQEVIDTDSGLDDYLTDSEIEKKIDIFIDSTNPKRLKYTKAVMRRALRDYAFKTELTMKKVANLHDVSFETLRKWVKKAGITSRLDIKKPIQKIKKLREEDSDITREELSREIKKTKNSIRYYDRIRKQDILSELIQQEKVDEKKLREIEEDYKIGWWYLEGLAIKHKLPLLLIEMVISEAKKKGIVVDSVREKHKSRELSQDEIEKIKKDYLEGELTWNGIIHFNKVSHTDLIKIKQRYGLFRKRRIEDSFGIMEYLYDLALAQNRGYVAIDKSKYYEICLSFNITDDDLKASLCVINEWLSMKQSQREILQKIANDSTLLDYDDRFFRRTKKPEPMIESTQKEREEALHEYKINEAYQKYALVLGGVSDEKIAEIFGLNKRQMWYIKNKAKRFRFLQTLARKII